MALMTRSEATFIKMAQTLEFINRVFIELAPDIAAEIERINAKQENSEGYEGAENMTGEAKQAEGDA